MRRPMYNLTLLRKKKGLTQTQLGEIVGLKKDAISAYERGDRFPKRETLYLLASALDCKLIDLLEEGA